VVIADHAGSAPNNVVEAAKDARDARRRQADAGEEDQFEEVWVSFDTEGPQNPDRLAQARNAIERARQLGFLTAVSNPCFEYWLLLHFVYFVRPIENGAAACKLLRKHIPKYGKGLKCFDIIYPNTDTARERANRVFEERHKYSSTHPCDCHPCTEVHKLVESLLGED